ncbi:MAG: prepilin-type N-terminal cleavage/methylation domain-containing protein, partial [Cetobacterium sp.]
MTKIRGKKKAVTLLELVIVLALMSLVTMLVFNFSSLTQRKEKELDIKQELQHRGNTITESFMKNILQCKNIDKVIATNPIIAGDNKINSIVINIDGEAEIKTNHIITNVEKIEYRLDGDKLKFFAQRRVNPSDVTLTEVEVQTIAEDVLSMKILNKDVLDEMGTSKPLGDLDVEKAITDSKGVNLEIRLKKK